MGCSFGTMVEKILPVAYGSQRPPCTKCGKQHNGDCMFGSGVCYHYGELGHMQRDCLMLTAGNQRSQGSCYQPKQPAQARVYSLTPSNVEIDENDTDVITGIITLFGSLTCILFDSGATH